MRALQSGSRAGISLFAIRGSTPIISARVWTSELRVPSSSEFQSAQSNLGVSAAISARRSGIDYRRRPMQMSSTPLARSAARRRARLKKKKNKKIYVRAGPPQKKCFRPPQAYRKIINQRRACKDVPNVMTGRRARSRKSDSTSIARSRYATAVHTSSG